MTLANASDANAHLDGTKITFVDNADALPEATKADRVVKARLAGEFPDHVLLWDANPVSPQEQTPEIVNLADSLLMASYRYQKIYSEVTLNGNDYAARLQAQADDILDGLASGKYTLYDKPNYVLVDTVLETDFWPNNTTRVDSTNPPVGFDPGDPERLFSMDRGF